MRNYLIIIFLVFNLNIVSGQDWPMFRGDSQHSALASEVSDTLFQYATWTFSTEGSIFASPVVSQGKVFFAATDNYVYCVEDSTGNLIWKTKLGSWVESTPAISGGQIYVGAMDHNFYALSVETGEILWQTDLGSWIESSPVVIGNSVYVGGTNDQFYSLDTTTGSLNWQFPVERDIYASPAYKDGVLFFGGDDQYFYAVDTLGQLRWKYNTEGYSIFSSPTVVDSTVIFGTIDNGVIAPPDTTMGYSWNNQIIALNTFTGAEAWKLPVENFGLMHSSPAADEEAVYFSTDQGVLRALDLVSGSVLWEKMMPDSSLVWASPAIAAGVIYLPTVSGRLCLLSTKSGEELANFTLTGDSLFIHASPAITPDFLYFAASNGKVYALSKIMPTRINQTVSRQPVAFELFQNYPNPFNPNTFIRYNLLVPEFVKLTIYNLLGQKVRTLVNELQPIGTYNISWDGRDDNGLQVASGNYTYRIEAGPFKQSSRMLLLR